MKWKKNPFDDCNHFFPSFFNSFNVRTFERSLYDHQWASTLANVASYCLWLLRQYYRTILMVFSMCEASCLPLQNFAHSTLCVIRGGSSKSARTETHTYSQIHTWARWMAQTRRFVLVGGRLLAHNRHDRERPKRSTRSRRHTTHTNTQQHTAPSSQKQRQRKRGARAR